MRAAVPEAHLHIVGEAAAGVREKLSVEGVTLRGFVDDLYAYLKARADDALPRGRPQHADKPTEAKERDDACLAT